MKQQASNKTEEILNSLDGVKKIKAPDFFYTRLIAKMETSPTGSQINFLRPIYAIAFLALLIAFNLISILNQNNDEENTVLNNETEANQTIALAYNFDDSFSYELNQ